MLKQKYHAGNVRAERVAVKALHMNGMALLKKAKARRDYLKKTKEIQQAYVVFDRDALTQADLIACERYARTEQLEIIFSSINFEIWILMHFEPVTRRFLAKDLVRKLSGEMYFGQDYHKFKGDDYTDYLVDRVRTAELNAQKLREQQNELWYKRDPHTQVDDAVIEIFGVSER